MSIQKLLKDSGLKARKNLGQCFLADPYYLDLVASGTGITKNDTVLEIGAGIGNYTRSIASLAKKVFAMEFDRDLIRVLKNEASMPNVEIIEANALTFDYSLLPGNPGKYKVIGNLPYNIATEIIFRLLGKRNQIISMSFVVQFEVAKRLVAEPGSRASGVLGVIVQAYTEVELVAKLPASAFYPRPKVDSALVKMEMLDEPLFPLELEHEFRTLVKAAFSKRRKTLANSLLGYPKLNADRDILVDVIKAAGLDPKMRAETLKVEDFVNLTRKAQDMGIFEPIERK